MINGRFWRGKHFFSIGIKLSLALFFTVLIFCSQEAQAASFDCQKAATLLEKAICADGELSKLDEQMGACYKSKRAAAKDTKKINAEQKVWIKKRNACKDNVDCLKKSYLEYLAQYKCEASAPVASKSEKAPEPEEQAGPANYQARKEFLQKLGVLNEECEDSFKEGSFPENITGGSGPAPGIEEYVLEDGVKLYVILCAIAAYQANYTAVVFNESTQKGVAVEFSYYDSSGDDEVEKIVAPDVGGTLKFNEKDKTLTVFSKARGLGDCGSLVVYKYQDGNLKVVEAKAQACQVDEQKMITDPEKWPVVKNP